LQEKGGVDPLIESLTCLLEFIIKNMMLPGQVESWNLIIDLEGLSVMKVPKEVTIETPHNDRYEKRRL
jgi:CRAL/TRIO domain